MLVKRTIVCALPFLVSFFSAVKNEDSKKNSIPSIPELKKGVIDEEILNKLRQKKLVTLQVSKPEECDILSEKNDEVQVHYTGYLETGEVFDSSEKNEKDPITFTLGSGQVIRGWDEGLLNMCAGEKRRLLIPSDLAYGKAGFPPVIPPDATLLFEVTLVALRKHGPGGSLADPEYILQLAKFLFLPAIIIYAFYYMYSRYKAEEAQKGKDQKHQSRGKNSSRKKR